jgi:PAS domain S-box-containing protein
VPTDPTPEPQATQSQRAAHALRRLARRLSRPMTPDEFGRQVAAECRLLLQHDAFLLTVFDEKEENAVALWAEDTAEGASKPEPITDTPTPRAVLYKRFAWRGESCLLNRRHPEDAQWLTPFGHENRRARSLMFSPIFWEDRQVGVLTVQSYTPDRYDARDLRTLDRIADTCGVALAHQRVKRRLEETHARERSQAQQALRESRELLQAIVRLAPDAIFIRDRAGRFILCNPAGANFLGRAPEEVVGRTVLEVFGPQDGAEVLRSDELVMRSRRPVTVELRLRMPAGERTYQSTKVPYLSADGELLGVIGIARDVTDRRRAEDDLRDARTRLELLHRIGVTVTPETTVYQLVHTAVRELNLSLPGCRAVYSMIDEAGATQRVASAGPETPSPARLESPVRLDGRLVGLLELEAPAPHDWTRHETACLQEVSEHLVGEIRNLEIQESLARQADVYKTILRAQGELGIGVVLTEGEKILSANDAVCAFSGYTEDQLKALPSFLEVMAPDQRAPVADRLRRRMRGEPVETHYESTIIAKDGRAVDLEFSVRPVRIEPRMRAVVVLRDVTGRKQLERNLQHTQKLESLGVMAGGIAHDFNNILAGVLGHADLAMEKTPPEHPSNPHLLQIHAAAQRAAALTQQLLAYAGKAPFASRAVDLSALVGEMASLLSVTVSKRARLQYALDHRPAPITADPAQVQQVVLNLITNASEALGERGGTIALTTGEMRADRAYMKGCAVSDGAEDGRYAWVEVSDDGCGMDADTQRRIFDPFFTTKFKGRGLGLATVLGIVRMHRGAVRIDSAPGQGTTIRVLFPADAGRPTPTPPPAPPPAPAAWRGQGAILVVDDEADVREVAGLMLQRLGFSVQASAGGRDAVRRFGEDPGRFAAVLLDMTMPDMDGRQTFAELRRLRPDLPIVLCSGYAEEETAAPFEHDGRFAFLQKPFTLESLADCFREVLQTEARR